MLEPKGLAPNGEPISPAAIVFSTSMNTTDGIVSRAQEYRGFTLIAGDLDRLCAYSNRGGGIESLAPGVHGVSNHLLNTPWPKIVRGKQRLAALLRVQRSRAAGSWVRGGVSWVSLRGRWGEVGAGG